jgi:putative ABC transport system permease protein
MRRFIARLINVFRRDRVERDLAREMGSHLATLEDEYVRRGLSPENAKLAARRAMGSVALAADRHRDERSFIWIDDLRRDVSHAARSLRRSPGFAAIAVSTLALGIGATTAIFSVLSAVLLRPLPYQDADRLVQVLSPPPVANYPRAGLALLPSYFFALRDGVRTLEHVAGYVNTNATLTGVGDAVGLNGIEVTASAFPLLGVSPIIGRTFETREEARGPDSVVVLSHSTWQRYFNSDPTVVGRVVAFNGRGRTIIGVMPERFAFPDTRVEYWVPYVPPPPESGSILSLFVFARLREGVVREVAETEVNAIISAVASRTQGRFEINGLQDELVASVKPALMLLAAAVGLVLLIACVNVANLLLSRTASRQHEIAVRRAVGASPGRLVRQLLTESGLLALLGGLAGTALAVGGVRLLLWLAATLPRRDLGDGPSLPRLDEIGIDEPVLLFTIVVAAVTGVLSGLLPAVRHARLSGVDRLREPGDSPRVRSALVIAEVAMAMTLLIGGALLMHSLFKLATAERGFDPSNVLTFQASPRAPRGPQGETFADRLVERIASLPGVVAAGYGNNLPLVQLRFGRDVSAAPTRPGRRREPPGSMPGMHFVSPRFVAALGMRLVEGRTFSEGAAAHGEALITQTFARSAFFDGPALGRHIYSGDSDWEVVGILEDMKQFSLQQRPASELFVVEFVPAPPGLGGTYFAVRTTADPIAIVGSVRTIAKEIDPLVPIENIAMMDQIVSNAMSRPRLYAVLLGLFAMVAVVLAAIGIYGVLGFLVTRRTREIGIRVALGARREQVIALIVRQTAALTVTGVIVGVAAAAALSRYLEGLLFGVTPLDPATFIGVIVLFGLVAAAAAYVPTRRATRINPITALRAE